MGTSQRNYLVSVVVGGIALGVFDAMEGGDVDSEEFKYQPGGMAQELSLGGRKMFENITVRRIYDVNRDDALWAFLQASVGTAPASVMRQPLTASGEAQGAVRVYSGTLKRLKGPDSDSTSSDAAMLELEVTVVAAA